MSPPKVGGIYRSKALKNGRLQASSMCRGVNSTENLPYSAVSVVLNGESMEMRFEAAVLVKGSGAA
jgi:hypothetical protein